MYASDTCVRNFLFCSNSTLDLVLRPEVSSGNSKKRSLLGKCVYLKVVKLFKHGNDILFCKCILRYGFLSMTLKTRKPFHFFITNI